MADDKEVLKFNELSDHDLLVRIATQVERLPLLEERVRELELEMARLRQWAPVLVAAVTGASVVISAVVGRL